MARKEFRGQSRNGKGKRPMMGYNYKKWNANFDEINWSHKKKDTEHEPAPSPTTASKS